VNLSEYIAKIPPERRKRFGSICRVIEDAAPGMRLTFRYRMPTYEGQGDWVAVGNQRHHIGIYFCDREHVQALLAAQPHLDAGKGCVRVRDGDSLDLEVLGQVFRKQMG
jgi:uncharacterized protein YdhG (YjbR/CyaY superfamily)